MGRASRANIDEGIAADVTVDAAAKIAAQMWRRRNAETVVLTGWDLSRESGNGWHVKSGTVDGVALWHGQMTSFGVRVTFDTASTSPKIEVRLADDLDWRETDVTGHPVDWPDGPETR